MGVIVEESKSLIEAAERRKMEKSKVDDIVMAQGDVGYTREDIQHFAEYLAKLFDGGRSGLEQESRQ